MEKKSFIYILTNNYNTVLYTVVTSDLVKRMKQHRTKAKKGFSSKYNIHKLVFLQAFDTIESAIIWEKRLKGKNRKKKIQLIEAYNPQWEDLYPRLFG